MAPAFPAPCVQQWGPLSGMGSAPFCRSYVLQCSRRDCVSQVWRKLSPFSGGLSIFMPAFLQGMENTSPFSIMPI